jgi:hypothetical protein
MGVAEHLWKECLNHDGQEFHYYQQNVHPSLTSNNFFLKHTAYGFGNPCPIMGQAQKCGLDKSML